MFRLGQSVVLVSLEVSQDLHMLVISSERQSGGFELHGALGSATLKFNLLSGVEGHGVFSPEVVSRNCVEFSLFVELIHGNEFGILSELRLPRFPVSGHFKSICFSLTRESGTSSFDSLILGFDCYSFLLKS